MKYLIVVPDGAGDEPIPALGDKTPLEVADMPFIDSLAAKGTVGSVSNVPPGIPPGSDVANLSIMGYDPKIYLTGRSPLEAVNLGVKMIDGDVAFRANIITLEGDGDYEDLIIKDHSSGEITTEEADQLLDAVRDAFNNETISFYTGTSYRHCMIMHNGRTDYELTPPHDVLGQRVGDHLPKGEEAALLIDMMKKSYEILKDHPVNKARIAKGLNPANSLWIWGQGTKPNLYSFFEKRGLTGTAISAVDLIKGIALCAGLDTVEVEGATGTLNTNFKGKADAAIKEFRSGKDFVFVHLEGPDECGHQGDTEGKIKCLSDIDAKIVKPIVEALREDGEDFKVLELPDHKTPIAVRTHTSVPVPFVMYDSTNEQPYDERKRFCEESGKLGKYYKDGYVLADEFLK